MQSRATRRVPDRYGSHVAPPRASAVDHLALFTGWSGGYSSAFPQVLDGPAAGIFSLILSFILDTIFTSVFFLIIQVHVMIDVGLIPKYPEHIRLR